jgi:hypothetical protein
MTIVNPDNVAAWFGEHSPRKHKFAPIDGAPQCHKSDKSQYLPLA